MAPNADTSTRVPLAREPGKSLLPLARVQKILKADEELPTVAKEATFLIARAAEEFIIRMSQETYQVAAREKRTILQERDISTVVRKNEEYWYLRELLGNLGGSTAARAKPKRKEKDSGHPREATLLDRFVQKDGQDMDAGEDDDIGEVIENEDGTMSMG